MRETFRLEPQKNLFVEQMGTEPNQTKKKKRQRFQKKTTFFKNFVEVSSFMTRFQFLHV